MIYPDGKVRVANMGPTWVLAAPGGPHVGPMNLAIQGTIEIWEEDEWLHPIVLCGSAYLSMSQTQWFIYLLLEKQALSLLNTVEIWRINVIVQDCSISSALAIEILQSCSKPSK